MNTEIYLIKKRGGEVGAEEKHLKSQLPNLPVYPQILGPIFNWSFLYCKHESNKFRKNAIGEE